MSESRWIDVSVPMHPKMAHWPGDRALKLWRDGDMDQGDMCNVTMMSLCAHTGTHMDAPLHFVREGAAMEQLPLEAVLGPARVVEVDDPASIKLMHLEACAPARGERLLFKTRNSARCWERDTFFEDYVYIEPDAAAYLAQCGVQTVGIDYLSVGGFAHGNQETHVALLEAGIWLIEGLNLSACKPGLYEMACLPLLIVGADGAPARAALRPLPKAGL